MSMEGRQWEVVVGFQTAMRELEAQVINLYMTDPGNLGALKSALADLGRTINEVIAPATKCGLVPCMPPYRCCNRDGMCKLICEVGPGRAGDEIRKQTS